MAFWAYGIKNGEEYIKIDESSDNNILGMQDQRGKEPKNGVVMRQQLSRHAEFKMERNTLKLVCQ